MRVYLKEQIQWLKVSFTKKEKELLMKYTQYLRGPVAGTGEAGPQWRPMSLPGILEEEFKFCDMQEAGVFYEDGELWMTYNY